MQRHDAHQARRALDDQAVMSSASIRPGLPGLSQLANRTIRLPLSDEGIDLGAITLGERIGGDGHYGFVYAIAGRPGLALKLIHRERSGPPSIARQVAGYRLLERFPAEIPTVKIVASHCGDGEEACYLVVENLHHGRWADHVVVATGVLGERERAAARRLYDNLAARRIVAADCHRDNLFFFSENAGDLTAGILDHDYIFDMEEIPRLRQRILKRLSTLAGPRDGPAWAALDRAVKGLGVSAQELMEAFFELKILQDVR